MNTTIEKPLDYRCFLLGIVVYWIFDSVWASFAPFFFALEAVMNPIAVVIGKSILKFLVFYLLFHKAKMPTIKWGHILMLVAFLLIMSLFDVFLVKRFFENHSPVANMIDNDIPNYVMQNVRKWSNLITSVLIIGFIWWRYDTEGTASDNETSTVKSQSYFGGMLFAITLGYILSLIRVIGSNYWMYTLHPILEEVITCLLILVVTIGAIYLLAKKRMVILPIVVVMIIFFLHFFSANYLFNIIAKYFTINDILYPQVSFIVPVATICCIAFNLIAFILYRKELEKLKE